MDANNMPVLTPIADKLVRISENIGHESKKPYLHPSKPYLPIEEHVDRKIMELANEDLENL